MSKLSASLWPLHGEIAELAFVLVPLDVCI